MKLMFVEWIFLQKLKQSDNVVIESIKSQLVIELLLAGLLLDISNVLYMFGY